MRIVGGTARSRTIEAPPGLDTRPTLDRVRENLFNILQHRVRGARVLDLFAGSGALGLEAISRGAHSAVLADLDRNAHRIECRNAEKLGFKDQCTVLLGDWKQVLARLAGDRFDLVFLDPPYAMTDLREVTATLLPLLSPEATVVVEHRRDTMPAFADGYLLAQTRLYGIAALTFLNPIPPAERSPA